MSAEADMRDLSPPSTVACSPAPNRGLVIIRTDSQPLPAAGAFSSFDKFLSQGLLNQNTPYQKHSSILNSVPSADAPSQQNKKRWSLLKTILPFGGSPSNGRPGEVTPPGSPDEGGPQLGSIDTRATAKDISRPSTPPHQAFSFKFSLEWVDQRNNTNRNRRLVAPILATNAQRIVDVRRTSHESSSSGTPSGSGSGSTNSSGEKSTSTRRGEIKPVKPQGREIDTAKYSGRALAEWAGVMHECRNFYLRRKQEGVPRDALVETPTLGVETFRMLG